jgi:hypothetical protein
MNVAVGAGRVVFGIALDANNFIPKIICAEHFGQRKPN